MFTENELYIYKKILENYNNDSQVIVLISELSEFGSEITKYIHEYSFNKDNIIDEIADVLVMLDQIYIMFQFTYKISEYNINNNEKLYSYKK